MNVELWAEATHNPPAGRLLRRGPNGYRPLLMEIVRWAQERGEIHRRLDPEAVSRVMVCFFTGLLLQKALDRDEVNVQEHIEVVKAMAGGTFWLEERPEEGGS